MVSNRSSRKSGETNKGIAEMILRKAPVLILVVVLFLPVISLASAQEARATGDLIAAESAVGQKTPVPYVDSAGRAHECTNYTNASALGSGEWTMSDGWYVLDQNATNSSSIRVNGKVNLILCDGKTLSTTHVLVESGNTLTIWAQKNGTGKLKATGEKNYAGIGSGAKRSCGTVVIHGGDIEARGGTNGAGIGGGNKGNGGDVFIDGGAVRAYGAESDAWFASSGAAGIGGGRDGSGGTVQIRGGKVYAKGAEAAAGIGGGGDADPSTSNSGYGGDVLIIGGKVEAYGGTYGAGIGGGFGGSYGTIRIQSGTVRAEAGVVSKDVTNDAGAAGIGGGHAQKTPGSLIEITGGNVDAIGRGGAGIGGGSGCSGGTIEIKGGTVEAVSGVDKHRCNGAGIGGGVAGSGGTITISGGYVAGLATGAGAGIGGGSTGSGGTITISGGLVFAVADWNRFNSENYMKSNHYKGHSGFQDIAPILFDVALTNFVNKATSGEEAGAGIGGGYRGNGGAVRIEDGSVFAMSGLDNIPAIGRGIKGDSDGSLYVYDTATVTAGSTVGSGKNAEIKTEKQAKANRASACKQKRYATVLPCFHDDSQFIDYSSDNHKVGSCKWCEADGETLMPHEFDSETHTCTCGHKQYKLTVKQNGEGSVFVSGVRDAMKSGDSTWISKDSGFMTTVRPASAGHEATMRATYGSAVLNPEGQNYEIDPDSGMRIDWRSDTMPDADVELTVDISKGATISFDKGKSTDTYVMQSVTWRPGDTYTIPQNLFSAPRGMKFDGWKITGPKDYGWGPGWDPNKKWQPDETLVVPTDITLTAQWEWKDRYAVWVGGTKVDANNQDDVLGNGTVSYNPNTRTLTLAAGEISISGTNEGNALIWANELDFTVVGPETGTDSANVHAESGSTQYGIRVSGVQTLTVRGRITVGGVAKCGLDAVGYVFIRGDTTFVEASLSGTTPSATTTPIYSGRRIRLDSALEITEPSNGKLSDDKRSIVDSTGSFVDHVVIQNPQSQEIHTCEWDEGEITVEPSCTTEGTKVFTCKIDPSHTKEESIDATGHTGVWVKDPIKDATCTEPGYYYNVYKCSKCGEILTSRLVREDCLPHQWGDWFLVEPPTCTAAGMEARLCERGYDHVEARNTDLDPDGHVGGEPQIENEEKADCEHDGSYDEVVYCEYCGKELSRVNKTTSALGHKWAKPTYTWTLDDSAVTAERHCVTCGKKEEETVETSTEVTVKPTSTKPGKATVTASFKNPAFVTQTKKIAIAPSGADPDSWTYTVKFDANGGTGTMGKQTFVYGAKGELAANKFKRTGYTFAGWNTQANGKGDAYEDKASVKNLSEKDGATVTLYAQWKRASAKGTLLAKMYAKRKGLAITWTKVTNVDGYDVFFSRCNRNGAVCVPKKVSTVKGDRALSATMKGLKPGKSYKAYVKAWVLEAGKKVYVKKSPTIYAFAAGKTKEKISRSSIVALETSQASVRVGKVIKIKASLGISTKNSAFPTKYTKVLRYYSSNKKVATVSKTGKVKGRSEGTCKIYVMAANGERKAVAITVK